MGLQWPRLMRGAHRTSNHTLDALGQTFGCPIHQKCSPRENDQWQAAQGHTWCDSKMIPGANGPWLHMQGLLRTHRMRHMVEVWKDSPPTHTLSLCHGYQGNPTWVTKFQGGLAEQEKGFSLFKAFPLLFSNSLVWYWYPSTSLTLRNPQISVFSLFDLRKPSTFFFFHIGSGQGSQDLAIMQQLADLKQLLELLGWWLRNCICSEGGHSFQEAQPWEAAVVSKKQAPPCSNPASRPFPSTEWNGLSRHSMPADFLFWALNCCTAHWLCILNRKVFQGPLTGGLYQEQK